jgi:hypothetical protein
MSAVTYSGDLAFSGDVKQQRAQTQVPRWFLRLVVALYRSRELQAAREIERHRHLIDASRKTAASTWA